MRPSRWIALATFLGLVGAVPLAAIEAAPPTQPDVDRRVIDLVDAADPGWEEVVDLPVGAEMVAFTWAGSGTAEFVVRGQRTDDTWTEPLHLEAQVGENPDGAELGGSPASGYVGPAWLDDDLTTVDVRLEAGSVSNLQLHAIDTEPLTAPNVAEAALGMPAAPWMYTRSQWDANESWRDVNDDCGDPKYAQNAHYSIVHHTAGSNTYGPNDTPAILRAIYEFHVFGRGWCDVAYNFFVDRFGQVFEGRFGGIRDAVVGGHTGGFNTGSVGVAVVGDFDAAGVPSATYASLRRLLAFKLGQHGIDPQATTRIATVDHPSSRFPGGRVITMPTVGVHGDFSQTACPGANLRALIPRLRADLAADLRAAPYGPRVAGDWDGNGSDTIGTYDRGGWSLRDSNTKGPATRSFSYGYAGAIPVVGDWDGDGRDGIGIYDNGWWLLRNTPSPGAPEIVVHYGYAGAIPVVGDWDGNGRDGIGIYDGGWWLLRQSATPGNPELAFAFGWSGPSPVTGDWDGDGRDGIGVWNVGAWSLRQTATPGQPERSLVHGGPTDRAVAGDWTGRGNDGIGLVRGAYWYQSATATAAYDRVFWF